MIKTLKRKFIVSAMIAVTVLLVTLLGAVNAVNAWTTAQDTERLLENLVQMESDGRPDMPQAEQPPEGEAPPELPAGENGFRPEGEPPAQREEGRGKGFMAEVFTENDRLSAVYFTVWTRDGEVVRSDVSRISTVSETDAAALAQSVLAEDAAEGRTDSFRYASARNRNDETVYVFLENSARRNAVLRVVALSALAGLGGWLLMLGLVCLLAKARADQYLIYGLGNLLSLASLLLLKAWGKEETRKDALRSIGFALMTALLMQLGRALVALVLGNGLGVSLGFFTTGVITDLFTVVVVWIARRLDGIFEDQIHYLLRIQKEPQQG